MVENRVPAMATKTAGGLARLAWRSHVLLLVLLTAYAGLSQVMRGADAPEVSFELGRIVDIFGVILPMFALALIAFLYLRLMLISRGRSPLPILRSWIANMPWVDVFLFRFPLAVLFLLAIQVLYVSVKVNIPTVAPFSWDATFAEWDRALFFGWDPWVLTHAVFSTPLATKVIDGLYIAWFFAVYIGFLVFAALPMSSCLRLGFMLAFGLSWALGGSVLATMFSSAGPVYMERLFGDPSFGPLMARLHEQSDIYSIQALSVQELLWQGYLNPDVQPVGISAFPSMHNCVMVVIVMGVIHLNRLAGVLMGLFACAIVIGSVHLGWHYFVDSLAGCLLGWGFWLAGLWLATWWLGPEGPKPHSAA
ncbi:MAG: phosphatase PAP2 family protein [Paracoccaceae bacterium]